MGLEGKSNNKKERKKYFFHFHDLLKRANYRNYPCNTRGVSLIPPNNTPYKKKNRAKTPG